jgi:hypothetical protein
MADPPPASAPKEEEQQRAQHGGRRLLLLLHGERLQEPLLRDAIHDLKSRGHEVCAVPGLLAFFSYLKAGGSCDACARQPAQQPKPPLISITRPPQQKPGHRARHV